MIKYNIGSILYKYIDNDKIEMLRVLKNKNDKLTLYKLNNNKIFHNVNIEKIKNHYNVLLPHIVISHIKCDDCDRLLVKYNNSDYPLKYIYDNNLKYHYSITTNNIIGFKSMTNIKEENIFKLHLYYIDEIREVLNSLTKINEDYKQMNILLSDELINDIYNDNNILDNKNINIEHDNNKIIKYHIGMKIEDNFKIIHAKNGIFLLK